ncbi:MAG: helix-turn-helix transcriptional regulator [Agromyces sp.]|nr:helix-turn-helix transcriptional regulator [Agromyces sp.]
MRVRRRCDLSQRDLAAALGIDASRIARLESTPRRVDLPLLVEILELADLRLAVLGRDGVEVAPVAQDVVRDHAGRRMPAHLDIRPRYERSVSTLLHGHADRREPPAWYDRRPGRDRRRLESGHRLEDVPDQPTRVEIGLSRSGRHAARTGIGQPWSTLSAECACSDECFERAACRSDCGCRCDG